jgi:intracellular multiplication protein IcmK
MSNQYRLTHRVTLLAAALALSGGVPAVMAQSVQPSLSAVATAPTAQAPNPANTLAPAGQPAPAAPSPQVPVPQTAAPQGAPAASAAPGTYAQQGGVPVQPQTLSPQALSPQGTYPQPAYPQAGYPQAGGQPVQPGSYAMQGGLPGQAVQPSQAPGTLMPPQVPTQELPPLPTPSSVFPKIVDEHLGVTPGQIRELHQTIDERQKAAGEWLDPPRSVRSSIAVALTPGAVPPVIRPYMGAATSFVVIDSTGQPWPVENVHPGNPALFTIDRLDGPQGSSFTVDALQPYGQSNLILKLAGVSTPVVINLIAGQRVQDASVEVRVQGHGPNAAVSYSSRSLPPGTDARLLPVLDGMAPAGATPLTVMGADNTKAWMLPNGHMLVRAPFKLLSPVIAATSSSDGTTVYELVATPKLLGMVDGNYISLTVSGW